MTTNVHTDAETGTKYLSVTITLTAEDAQAVLQHIDTLGGHDSRTDSDEILHSYIESQAEDFVNGMLADFEQEEQEIDNDETNAN